MSTYYHITDTDENRYTYMHNTLVENHRGMTYAILWDADIFFADNYVRVVGVNHLDLPIDMKIPLRSYSMGHS